MPLPDLVPPEAPVRRSILRVLAQGLTDADVAKLATFMRVGRDRLQHEWKLVFEGEVHVLLFGGPEPCTVMGMLDSPLEMRRVSDAAGPESATLQRPLQYDAVIDALLEVERRIGTPAPLPLPRAAAAPPPSRDDLYRLRRWPAAELVQQSAQYRRLASFLSARHLGLDELARLANVGTADCERFLQAVQAAGVLDVRPRAPAPQPARRTDGAAPAAAPASDTGLFGRIRRHLGLG